MTQDGAAKPAKPPTANAGGPASPEVFTLTDTAAPPPRAESPAGAVPASAEPAPTPAPPGDDVNTARLTRGLRTALSQHGGSVTLRLTPPELGFVRIQMELRDGVASVALQTEHESARTLLSHQLAGLRHALESQGITVERLDVQRLTPAPQQGFAQQQDGSAEQPASDGRSRGQYAHDSPAGRGEGRGEGRRQREPRRPGAFERAFLNAVA